ncbi:MAG: hypothetical protein SFY80_01875 [Verrucomicrobiota bacterium]|nr:hypothetical protein [Verrucomicrobiota bacterium]
MNKFSILIVIILFSATAHSSLMAAAPLWWTEHNVLIPNGTQDNYAAINLGQLKHITQKAALEMNLKLADYGGAGDVINSTVNEFNRNDINNYRPANLGQVKHVAKLFYDRLIVIGYDTRDNLIRHGYAPTWTHAYPWIPTTPNSQNYGLVNVGQLKLIFSFDFDLDSDADYLPNYLEYIIGSNPDIQQLDLDGDGINAPTDEYPLFNQATVSLSVYTHLE